MHGVNDSVIAAVFDALVIMQRSSLPANGVPTLGAQDGAQVATSAFGSYPPGDWSRSAQYKEN
eukprot:4024890-Karenia_brevis.AAC.1